MPILGAHMSVAGGFYKAAIAARKAGCDCVQIFTKNNNHWKAKDITEEQDEQFAGELKKQDIGHPISHASYLINMASPNPELREKSIAAMVIELQRADMLGISGVVVHPGSFTTSDEDTGIKTISESIDEVHNRLPDGKALCLLENTAGQGSNLGNEFEQLQKMIDGVNDPSRLGVCIDTCHAFAAGYAMGSQSEYDETFNRIEQTIGLSSIKAFHLNDSKKPFGSRKDRHENIGLGEMGIEPFRFLMNDVRFSEVPMYLETPKGNDDDGVDWDQRNLTTLRDLIKT